MSEVPATRADATSDTAPTTPPDDPAGSAATTATTIEATCEFDPDESSFVDLPTADLGPDDLCAVFDARDTILGADYQRAYALPDGRVLWLFQDAFLATSHGPELVHNVGLLQDGADFELLRSGTAGDPAPYLFADRTDRHRHWYWPLGGDIGLDGRLHVFVAELVEHGGARYLTFVEPVATWIVTIDVDDLHVLDERPAPDPSNELYGWSVVSAGDHTYLYAHCYRQFGYDPLAFAPDVAAHDHDCCADVTVARLPRGDFGARPEYWDGQAWSDDPSTAAAVIPREGRDINPTQVAVLDGRFVAVTKVGDWWGDTIYLDVAPAPEGPWRTYATVVVEAECDNCNTYFASVVPFGADSSSFVIGLSCNVWDGLDFDHYNPTFMRVPAPPDRTGPPTLSHR